MYEKNNPNANTQDLLADLPGGANYRGHGRAAEAHTDLSGGNQDPNQELSEMLRASISPPNEIQQPEPSASDLPPLEVLPPAAQRLILEAETALGINPAYSLAGIIFAAASAIGATHRVEIKPGYSMSVCFYMVMVGLPNSNKSGGLKFALKPIFEYDGEMFHKYRADMSNYRDAINAGTNPEKPTLSKILMSDYSRESLPAKHLENLRGLAIYKDELTGWVRDFNRYGGGGEEAFWNQNWSGTPISVDRKTSESVRIERPVINVVGTIQPKPLKELTAGDRGDNGFADRLLFAWPEIREKARWTESNLPGDLYARYQAAIGKLLELKFDTNDNELGEGWKPEDTPHLTPFSESGRKMMFNFFNTVNKPLCDRAAANENSRLASMHGKFDVQAPRLALVLQLLWYGYEEGGKEVITEQMTERAIVLTQWFRSQSMKVYSHQYEQSPLDDLTTADQHFYSRLPQSFLTNDAVFTGTALGMKKRTIERRLKDWLNSDLLSKNGQGFYSKSY